MRNRDAHGAEGWPLRKLGPKNRSKDRPLHGEGASGGGEHGEFSFWGGAARRKEEERSFHPGEAHGAHKTRCAARHAIVRRAEENRAAPLRMTTRRSGETTAGRRDDEGGKPKSHPRNLIRGAHNAPLTTRVGHPLLSFA